MNDRVIVLIATHLACKERYEYIKRALGSLRENKPDHVYVSCSYDQGPPDVNSWIEALGNNNLTVLLQPERLLQFEHYQILSKYCLDNDIVNFLDDDDLYHPDKIKSVKSYFKDHPEIEVIHHPYYKFGIADPPLTAKSVDDIINTYLVSDEEVYFVFDDDDRSRLTRTYKSKDVPLKSTNVINIIEYCMFSMRGIIFKETFTKLHDGKTFDQILEEHKGFTDIVFVTLIPTSIKFTDQPLMYICRERLEPSITRYDKS